MKIGKPLSSEYNPRYGCWDQSARLLKSEYLWQYVGWNLRNRVIIQISTTRIRSI